MNTQYIFFSGKGGVGKSSMAAATAVYHSEKGNRTLLVSTDPAGNLGDIFEMEISVNYVSVSPNLEVVQLDADKITDAYKNKILAPLAEILEGEALESVKEQFNGGCTVEIATFDRFTDFLSDTAYDYIIFDTAPTGHTLRLMTLPGEWNDYIAKSAQGSGQTCIGPVSQIQDAKGKYEHAVRVMQDPSRTIINLVARPEKTSVYETQRAKKELEKTGIHNYRIIINGIIPDEVGSSGTFSKLKKKQARFIRELTDVGAPVMEVPMQAGEIKGYQILRQFADIVYNKKKSIISSNYGNVDEFDNFVPPQELIRLIKPQNKKRILAFTGKGGVGKTVAACAVATQVAHEGKTLLITTDPAAHIGQVLDEEVNHYPVNISPNLWATNIDQRIAGEEYKSKILSDAREQNYSEELKTSLAEELESPCTEEIAVFQKFAQHITDGQWEYVVIDTAPTGHTLRLLELQFDFQQQLESKGKTGDPVSKQNELINQVIESLKDPAVTRFFMVAYPEYTPLHESKRAANDLRRVGINIAGVLINQILNKDDCKSDFASSRWKMQQHYLQIARELFDLPLFALPLLEQEIAGSERIEDFRKAIFKTEVKFVINS